MARKIDRIKKGLDEYLNHLSTEERSRYLLNNTALLSVIHYGENDEAILSGARKYDEQNGTDLFSEIIKFRIYCSECRQLECTCEAKITPPASPAEHQSQGQ